MAAASAGGTGKVSDQSRRAFRFTPAVKSEPCWGNACTQPAAPDDEQRWRGHYCRDCQHRLRADAARIEKEETR